MEEFLPNLMQEGPFAILFVYLLYHQMQENKKQIEVSQQREDKLTSFLDGMKDEFVKLVKQYEGLSSDVEDIKTTMQKKNMEE